MIVHVRHARGLNHVLSTMPGDGPVVLATWSTEGPRMPTARVLRPEEVEHVLDVWRTMRADNILEVVLAEGTSLERIAA